MVNENKKIRSFKDLEVYNISYDAMLKVHGQIVKYLPEWEKYDLQDQLRRSTKSIPRLVAEGYSKKHQKRGFQKYIDDAMAESNETVVSLSQSKDLYPDLINTDICDKLITVYDRLSRQLYCLAAAWDKFNYQKQRTSDHTSS